jgi:DNA-binding NarL/FixJ family response regulator
VYGDAQVTKLVIVDDHQALREGLAALLAGHEIEVLGAAGNVAAGRDLVEQTEPDVALVDTHLPDGSGIDLTRELLARRPHLGVILYTGDAEAEALYSGLDSGARGYLLKAGAMSELVAAINRIAAGGSHVDPRLDRILLFPRATAQVPQLSPGEHEIMHLLADGRTPEEIVDQLDVSSWTIRAYLRDIGRKLRRRNR